MNSAAATVLQTHEAQRNARTRKHGLLWAAYCGEYPPRPLRVKPGGTDDNITINYARLIVNTGVSKLFGDGFSYTLPGSEDSDDAEGKAEGGDDEDAPGEAMLETVLARSGGVRFWQRVGTYGGVYGKAAIKIVPDGDGNRDGFRLVAVEPSTLDVTLDPQDVDRVVEWRVTTTRVQTSPQGERQVVQRIETCVLVPGTRGVFGPLDAREDSWQIVVTEKVNNDQPIMIGAPVIWDYAFPPYFACDNLPCPGSFWGFSDIEPDLLSVCSALNFVLSNTNRILKLHAHPKTVGTGVIAKELKIGPDEAILLNKDASLKNLEMQSDMGANLALARDLTERLHAVARLPEVTTGKSDRLGAVSGVALQVLYQPLVEQVTTKRHTYGAMIAEVFAALLVLSGIEAEFAPQNVTLVWPEVVPSDTQAERNTLLLDQQLGVSKYTALKKAGYDPEVEAARRKAEANEAMGAARTAFNAGGQPGTYPGADDEPDDKDQA